MFLQIAKVIKLRTARTGSGSGATKRSTNYGGGSNKKKKTFGNPKKDKPYEAGNKSDGRGSSGASRSNYTHGRDTNRDKDKKGADLKGEDSTFLSMWHSKGFSEEAIALIHDSGLNIEQAVKAASFKQPGRISKCLDAWQIITKDKKILSIVADGYRLQFEGRPPPTPFHGVNPPSKDEAKDILRHEKSSKPSAVAFLGN